MVEVTVTARRVVEAPCSPEEAYALVSDVPRSAGHFPGLKGLDDEGGGRYRWRLDRFEIGPVKFDAGYLAAYTCDADAGTVRWETVDPTASSVDASGAWAVTPHGSGCRLTFDNRTVVRIPAPRLTAPAVRKLAPGLAERQISGYVERIAEALGGRLVG